jgi:hypothetical protein
MRTIVRSLAAGALFALLAAIPVAAADLALTGTWQLSPAKSHFSNGELPAKLVLTIEADGSDGLRYRSANMVAGKAGGATWTAHFDGKAYPVTGTSDYDTVTVQKVDSRTFHLQMRKHGELIVDLTYTVAADGKSLTRKGESHKAGQENHFDEWFDRQ